MLTERELAREAAETGFLRDPLEKVVRLIELLEALRSHPFLKPRIALKGGTALNLFLFNVPRLSVDVDLNYIGTVDREAMEVERPRVEQAVQAVCGRLGVQTRRTPTEHAGGKWRLSYQGAAGRPGTLELDLNFLLRAPLWPVATMDSRPVGSFRATRVPVLDVHELAAGKIMALLNRNASRDLFDVRELLQREDLDHGQLRTAHVVYGGIQRRDWRTVSADGIAVEPSDVERGLLPMLRTDLAPAGAETIQWTRKLVADCRNLLSVVLPLREDERSFLHHLNDRGEIHPELITDGLHLQDVIRSHPGLRWKALNVRRHHGLDGR